MNHAATLQGSGIGIMGRLSLDYLSKGLCTGLWRD